jgi:MoaA/NifB/PqqE/SkfB family radical SAM enzyme
MKLKLKEIIWEVTGKCNNGCTYCGSKELWKQDVNENIIKKIADSIAEYPPEEIDISGGDPLLVNIATHQYIIDKLSKTKCKILVNPRSLSNTLNNSDQLKILNLYSHVGVSINTQEELELWKEFLNKNPHRNIKFTVITNFNLTNFFLFDEFAKSIGRDTLWQIQFTMYSSKDKQQQLAIYNHPQAVKQLNDNIAKHPDLKLIFADNCNHGACFAGLSTIGILSDGEVVPCLSMRAWSNDITKYSEGNVLKTKLKEIWYSGFKANRFEEFKSCKDLCNGLTLKKSEKPLIPTGPIPRSGFFEQIQKEKFPPDLSVTLYGVGTDYSKPYPYPLDAVTAYAVSTGDKIFGTSQFSSSIMDALIQQQKQKNKDNNNG